MIFYKRQENGLLKRVDLELEHRGEFSPSVVDTSKYRPNVNELHNFDGGKGSRVPLYDFEDGKDTGLRLGVLRHQGADITEIQAAKDILEVSTSEATKEATEKLKKEYKLVKQAVKENEENVNKGIDKNSNSDK